MGRPPLMDGLLERVEYKSGMRGATDTPADDPAGVGIDDKGHIDETLPGGDIGEIRYPQPVRRGRLELPVHMVQRAWRLLV